MYDPSIFLALMIVTSMCLSLQNYEAQGGKKDVQQHPAHY